MRPRRSPTTQATQHLARDRRDPQRAGDGRWSPATSALLVIGIQESARVNNVIVAIKVVDHRRCSSRSAAPLLQHRALGDGRATRAAASFRPNVGHGQFGWSGILRGAGVVFFAYIGFDAVSTAAQEAKNPQRDMPIGILGSLVICTVLYVAVALRAHRHRALRQLNVPDPIAVGIDAIGARLLAPSSSSAPSSA